MKKINNLVVSIFILCMVMMSLIAPISHSVAANNCPPAGNEVPPKTAVCNPASNFFVDLTTQGYTNDFQGILLFGIKILLGVVGLVSMLFIIIGGFRYVTSSGDEELATSGKKTLTNAIIGLIIVILSYVVVVVIINELNKIK